VDVVSNRLMHDTATRSGIHHAWSAHGCDEHVFQQASHVNGSKKWRAHEHNSSRVVHSTAQAANCMEERLSSLSRAEPGATDDYQPIGDIVT
jgi:hypothetical protein